jgi:peptidoglycan/LPS O-acetylase OafA/YrhL
VEAAAQLGRTRRVGGLDGVRGVAIAAVLAYHAFPGTVRGGFLGVEVFFVLSGYLLTSLLLEERHDLGVIAVERYARRRVARVLPALVVVLLGVALLGRFLVPDDGHRVPMDVLSALGGFTNWHLIVDGSSYFRELGRPSLVRHLWSLAIEMQFYVLCPVLVGALARRRLRTAVAWLVGAIAASALAMTILGAGADPTRAYFGTDTRAGGLLTGVLLAFLLSSRGNGVRVSDAISSRRTARVAGVAGAVVLVGLLAVSDDGSGFLYPTGFVLCRLATAGLILAAVHPLAGPPLLQARVLRWLGQRSYGIYLWHWPILAVTRPGIDVGWPAPVRAAVVLACACILGELSFRWVERPFLRPRTHKEPQRHATQRQATPQGRAALRWPAVGLAITATGLVAAFLPSVDPIAASLRAGEAVVSSHSVSASTSAVAKFDTAATTTGTTLPAADAAPPEVVARPALLPPPGRGRLHASPPTTAAAAPAPAPPAAIPMTAVGDSVMLGAAGRLQAHLGPSAVIDAKVSRQFAEGVAEARRLRDEGRLGPVVFVHLGTNGPPRAGEVDAMVDALAGVQHVLLVNVRVDRKWEAATNRTLADGAVRHADRVKVVDWYGFSQGHRDWFMSDGTHLKPPGAEAYANLLAGGGPPPPPPAVDHDDDHHLDDGPTHDHDDDSARARRHRSDDEAARLATDHVLLGDDLDTRGAQRARRHALAGPQRGGERAVVDLAATARRRACLEDGARGARRRGQSDGRSRASLVRVGHVGPAGGPHPCVGLELGRWSRRGQPPGALRTHGHHAVRVAEREDRIGRTGLAPVVAAHAEEAGGYHDRGTGGTTVGHARRP